MKTDLKPRGALRLEACSYGVSRLSFRGPRPHLQGRYAAILGGADTFAKFVPDPFASRLEDATGEVCVNLGCQGAGPDVFLNDSAVQAILHDAQVAVLQVTGAANLSNAYYSVHPRRNDRFIRASELLVRLYPEVDFSEVAFTGHLVRRLYQTDPERFNEVARALRETWLRRMKTFVAQSQGSIVLFWFANRRPEDPCDLEYRSASDPLLVTRQMIEALRPLVSDIVEVVPDAHSLEGLCYAPLDHVMASQAMDIAAHAAAADALLDPVRQALG